MSDRDSRRNKKYGQNKEPHRTIIMVNTNKQPANDKPKILLKTNTRREPIAPAPVQISIATRPVDPSNNSDANTSRSFTIKQPTIASKDGKDPHSASSAKANADQPRVTRMKRPMAIISDHYQIISNGFDHLVETNSDFFVVGIIGTQGCGKSSILNLLLDDAPADGTHGASNPLKLANEVFKTRTTKEYTFSSMPATEGIQMFISRDRTIFLDCSAVLCNPYKKDCILNELDDLKMLIFLLSVCHQLIVVSDNGLNMNYLRLIQCAENMKMDADPNEKYLPNILFFRNKCSTADFLPEKKERVCALYREFFKESKLRIHGHHSAELNIFYFPQVDSHEKDSYVGHPDINLLIAELRQRVFMAPRHPFPAQNQQQTAFTEKNWSHLALAAWESHKNNYFLRKFETFKEKEWATRL